MGFEMSYQAIPANSGLLELARDDIESGERLSLLPYWFSRDEHQPAPGQEHPEDRLWNWCCQVVARHPELYTLNCYLDRTWDKLHFLLSATRRGEAPIPADLILDRAFCDGEMIAEHVCAGQGVPVRYISPERVIETAALVKSLDHHDLAAKYQPQRLEAAGVYKFWADRADAAEWQTIQRCFDDFRRFFAATAQSGSGCIVVRD